MRRVLMALALVPALACGGSSAGNDTSQPGDVPVNPDTPTLDVLYDAPGEDVPVPPEDGTVTDTPATGRHVEFLVDVLFPQQVPAKQSYTIRAKVVADADGSPVANVAVSYAIVKCEDLGGEEVLEFDGSLTASNDISDENGRVDGVFLAGESTELVYTVELTATDTPAARIQLVVKQIDCAKLLVKPTYPGTIGPSMTYDVSVLAGDRKCADLEAGSLPNPVSEAEGTDFEAGVEVACVPVNTTYTVFVAAKEACPVAVGCVEGVASLGKDEVTEATVALTGVAVAMAGTYTGTHKFTLTDAFPDCAGVATAGECAGNAADLSFPKRACCFLAAAEAMFAADGSAVAAALKAEGATAAAGHEADFGTAVDATVAAKVATGAPAWVADLRGVGAKALQAVRQVNLNSSIALAKTANDATIEGDETWTAYTIFWKTGCDPADPNYFACGKLTYLMDKFGGLAYAPVVPKSAFTARLGEGNRFTIDEHEVKLNPGRLLVFIANDVAVRALTGGEIRDGIYKDGAASNLPGALRAWADCEALAADLNPRVQSWYAGGTAGLKALCDAALTRATAGYDAALTAVTAPSSLRVSGAAAWTDTNCDLSADRFSTGEHTGTFVPPAGDPIPLTGSFSAQRQ